MYSKSKSTLSMVLITTAGLFIACATKAKAPTAVTSPLTGKWGWVSSSGGMTGATETANDTKTVKVLTFDKEGVITLTVNDKQELKDTYSLLRVKSIYSGNEVEALKYNSASSIQSYRISNDTLYLSEECHDCYSHVYVKKK